MQAFTNSAEEEQDKKTKREGRVLINMIAKLRFYLISIITRKRDIECHFV